MHKKTSEYIDICPKTWNLSIMNILAGCVGTFCLIPTALPLTVWKELLRSTKTVGVFIKATWDFFFFTVVILAEFMLLFAVFWGDASERRYCHGSKINMLFALRMAGWPRISAEERGGVNSQGQEEWESYQWKRDF